MYMAAVEGRGEIIVLLLSKGADVNARDNSGSTPLDWAREENQDQIANLIRQYGGKTGAELKALGK
jgi:ankyrin repeat protein